MKNQQESYTGEKANKKFKTLFIIGNGFDLAHHALYQGENKVFHGTSYADFEKAIPGICEDAKQQNNGHCYCQSDICYLQKIISSSGIKKDWSDFEKSLAKIRYRSLREVVEKFPDEGKRLDNDLGKWSLFIDSFFGDLQYAFEAWIRSVKCGTKKAYNIIDKDALYLTFNYTTTLENLYQIPANQVFHIHSEIKENQAEVSLRCIFGHEESDKKIKCRVCLQDVPSSDRGDYRQFLDCLRKDDEMENRDFMTLLESQDEIQNVHIIGHGLQSDKKCLKQILCHLKGADIRAYYWSETSLDKLEKFQKAARKICGMRIKVVSDEAIKEKGGKQ